MITPIFTKENDVFIVIDEGFVFSDVNKATEAALYAQIDLAHSDLTFNAEHITVTEELQIYPIYLPSYGKKQLRKVALIGGPTFDKLQRGERPQELLFTDTLNNNIYITERTEMEDKIFTVAIGIENDTFEPFVLIGYGDDTQMMSPERARKLADDLQFAAKASEVDSFFYKSLGHVFKDISLNEKENFMDAYRKFREEYMENNYGQEQEETDTSTVTKKEGRGEGNTTEKTSQNGYSQNEEVGELDSNEGEEEIKLKEAITKAYKEEDST